MITLRKYQQIMLEGIIDAFRTGHQGVFAQLPTGGGKTIVFCELIRKSTAVDSRHKAIIVAHTVELLEQASAKLTDLGVEHGIIQAQRNTNPSANVQVASIQTLRSRLLAFKPDLIVVDEAHMAPANSYQDLIKRYPAAKRLLVSATPCRTDGKGFDDTATKMVSGPSVQKLITEGHLVPVSYIFPDQDDPGLGDKTAPVMGGDDEAISHRLDTPRERKRIIKTYLAEEETPKRSICFAINQEHAKNLAAEFIRAGVQAEVLTSATKKQDRKRILANFRGGTLPMLVAVDIVSEGLDVPEVDAVLLARPTKSLAVYLQQVGRGMRPAPGKDRLRVFDFAWNVWRFGSVKLARPWTLKDMPDPQVLWRPDKPVQAQVGTKAAVIELPIGRKAEIISAHNALLNEASTKKTKQGNPYSHTWAFYQMMKLGFHQRELLAALPSRFVPFKLRQA